MKRILFTLALLLAPAVAEAQPASQWNVSDIDLRLAQHYQRACLYPAGGWTTIDCSNAASATSSQLHQWSRYVIQCGDDSYIVTGTTASTTATTSAGWLPLGAWLDFITTDTVRYVACRNKNADSDCRILECQ
jgi:hypothetical protein